MNSVESGTPIADIIRADSELLEEDLREFLRDLTVSASTLTGADGSPVLTEALRRAFHEPVREALGSKVGQEATRPATPGTTGFRPSIVYWVYRNYRGFTETELSVDLPTIRRTAVAVRILLKAAVALDDIEDGSPIRYGEPALHVTRGVPLALNTGSWMILAALRHIREPAVVSSLVQSVDNGFIGQALDMATRIDEVRGDIVAADPTERVRFWESVATLKTSTLFRMPLGAATTALKVPERERANLDDGMRRLGLASQLFNDLTDFVPGFGARNTHEDFDGLTNRVCLELLSADADSLKAEDMTGDRLKRFALEHPSLKETIVQLAQAAVELKENAKRQIHQLCASADSAAYFDMTIDRKGHLMERLYDALRE